MAAISTRTPIEQVLVGNTSYCDFSNLTTAFQNLPEGNVEIVILAGIYKENVKLYKDNVTIRGLGEVKILGNRYALEKDKIGRELGTFQTATFFINGENIHLENLTIQNNAGPGEEVGQAVALYIEGKNLSFKNCRLLGQQDTLCIGPLPPTSKDGKPLLSPWKKRIFTNGEALFEECYINGTVDFIFGGGKAKFIQCEVESLKRTSPTSNFITAPSTIEGEEGFYFRHCFIHGKHPYSLGRPWRPYGESHFEDCFMDECLTTIGWDEWGKEANKKTARFREINNHYATKVTRPHWIKLEV